MKIHIFYLISLLLLLLGCKKNDRLTFEPVSMDGNECKTCPLVQINFPKAIGESKIDKTINTAIRAEVVASLNFDDTTEATDIETAIISFSKAYTELKSKFLDETIQWEARIIGKVVFENKSILTMQLESYLFTGGAHGYSSKRFLNFDKAKGAELENRQLFTNENGFLKLAEAKFREQEKIEVSKPINSTGFMFDANTFYLPQNIGYTKDGLRLSYDQYEIASYADGPIHLTIPFVEIETYLNFTGTP